MQMSQLSKKLLKSFKKSIAEFNWTWIISGFKLRALACVVKFNKPVLIKKMPGEEGGELLNKWPIDSGLLNRIGQYQLLAVLDMKINYLFLLFLIFFKQK